VPETPEEYAVVVGCMLLCLWVFAEPGDIGAQRFVFYLVALIGVGLITYGAFLIRA
jgi:hypothetical protein